MANTRLGSDGEKVTEGTEVRFWLSPAQHDLLRERAVARTVEEGRPISMAQVLRELVDHGLRHPPKGRHGGKPRASAAHPKAMQAPPPADAVVIAVHETDEPEQSRTGTE